MARLSRSEYNKIKRKGGTKKKTGNKGYVYILSNPSFKNGIKIGMTQNSVDHRVRQLNGATGVPTPFKVEHFVESDDCKKLESDVHKILSPYRINSRREFFNISSRKAIKVVEKHNKVISGGGSGILGNIVYYLFILLCIAFVIYLFFAFGINEKLMSIFSNLITDFLTM